MKINSLEIKNSLGNNLRRQTEINGIFDSLPKGHINTLYRNNKGYYYLTYRDGNKIKNDYLGPVGKVDVNETISKLNERAKLKKELIELKKEEKKLKKLLSKANEIS